MTVVLASAGAAHTAAKGLNKGARINVHAIDALGVRATAVLASTTTGSDGTYKLQVPVSVRNLVVEASAAPRFDSARIGLEAGNFRFMLQSDTFRLDEAKTRSLQLHYDVVF